MSIHFSDNKHFFRGNVKSVNIPDEEATIAALAGTIEIAPCRPHAAVHHVGERLQKDSEYQEVVGENR